MCSSDLVLVNRADLTLNGIKSAFEDSYRETFGRLLQGPAIRLMNLRYARIGVRPKFDLAMLAPQGPGSVETLGTQRVYHHGRWYDALRYDRLALPLGAKVCGPAILEQADTTLWLEPGFIALVDGLGHLLIQRSQEGTCN